MFCRISLGLLTLVLLAGTAMGQQPTCEDRLRAAQATLDLLFTTRPQEQMAAGQVVAELRQERDQLRELVRSLQEKLAK